MRKLVCAFVLVLSAAPFAAFADQSLILLPGVRLWGLEGAIGLSQWDLAPPLDTILWAYVSGAWETNGFFRNPDGSFYSGNGDPGSPIDPATGRAVDPSTAPYYNQWNFRWRVGLEQGILDNPALPQDLLSAFVFYRGEVNLKLSSPGTQLIYYPDDGSSAVHSAAADNLRNGIMVGVKTDTLSFDKIHKTSSGIRAELSYEWAPPFLLNTILGHADYSRLNLTATAFLPLVELPADGDRNRFSLYLAEYFAADYLFGSDIPFEASASIGGISPIDGLGGAVRGFEAGRFDSTLKLVNNLELRASLFPVVLKNLVPGFVAFVDTGYYSGAYGAPSSPDGFIASTGIGISLDLLDLTTVCLYTEYLLAGERVTGAKWVPVDLGFDFHF